MTLVKNLAEGWHCILCGRTWAPGIVSCPICAKQVTKDERIQFLRRYGYRERIDRMVRTLDKAGV